MSLYKKALTALEESYYLQMPPPGFTQGDIWLNLPSIIPGKQQCPGIIITPRCDFAQNKSAVINYFPILSVSEAIAQFEAFSLLEQEVKSLRNELLQVAGKLRFTEVLQIMTPQELLSEIEGGVRVVDKMRLSHLADFQRILSKIDLMTNALKKNNLESDDLTLIGEAKLRTRKKELIKNNRSDDTFFLPPCTSLELLEIAEPCVVLFRYVGICSIDLLRAADSCCSPEAWEQLRAEGQPSGFSTCLNRPLRVLRLKSPFMECMMAKFSSLFNRVGIEDVTEHQINGLLELESKPCRS